MSLTVAIDTTPLVGDWTGIGVFTTRLLESLAQLDDSPVVVRYVLSRRAGALAPDTRRLAVPARAALALWAHLSWPREKRALSGVDVVHGTNYIAPPSGRPTVITVHDTSLLTHPERCTASVRAFVPVMRRLVGSGAWVHTPSEHVAGEVRNLLRTDRVRAIHHGAPPRVAPRDHALRPDRPFVLAVATAEPRKNLPRLVSAYGGAQRRLPELALVLAGPDGADGPAIQEAIMQLGPGALVVRTGWVDDATRTGLLLRARALAYPSLDEGFGLPMLEAMALGVPVVASSAGAIPEVAGDAALLVDPADTAALEGALVRVVEDESLRAGLIARGCTRVGAFSWARSAQGLTGLYRDAVAATSGHRRR